MQRLLSSPSLTEIAATLLCRVTAIVPSRPRPRAGRFAREIPHVREGYVWLVGAGPGDPELLTVKALRALKGADVILHDQLVSPEILALAPAHVERIDVGKKGYGRACRQSDINTLMVALARAGRHVARLKAGDPLMFGRLEEETHALKSSGIGYEVIPGISAAQGAGAVLGTALTRRRGARRFQAITGHAVDGRLPDDFDWAGLSDPKAVTAVYMPKATIGALCGELQRRGTPAHHPAVAVFNATRVDQRVIAAPIMTLPERIAATDCDGPCIILLGVDAPVPLDGYTDGEAADVPAEEIARASA